MKSLFSYAYLHLLETTLKTAIKIKQRGWGYHPMMEYWANMCEAIEMIPSNENYQTQDTSVKVRDSEITVGFNLYPTTYLGHQNLTYYG